MFRGAPTVEPCAKGGQHRNHVLHQIVFQLGFIHDQKFSATSRPGGLDLFRAKPHESITMPDNHVFDGVITQQP